MRLRWATKVALGAMIPAIVGLGIFAALALRQVRNVTADRIEGDLLTQVQILANALPAEELDRPDLSSHLAILAEAAEARITLIAADGTVLVDTDVEDVSALENHANRPEVLKARGQGAASQRRTSRTVDRELLYAAAVLPGTDVIVRLARDVSGIESELARPTENFWRVALIVLVLGAGASVLLARLLTRPVVELTATAQRVEAGDLHARATEYGKDELGDLARAFNEMTAKLRNSVAGAQSEAARLTIILETMDEGVVAVNDAERISFLNAAARRILGLEDDAYAGRSFYDLVREPQILAAIQMAADRSEAIEAEIHHEGPPRRLIGIRAAPVGETARGVILVLRDMSEMRRLERMRSDFVSNVSHELRTPLATIAAATETLQGLTETQNPETSKRFLEMIARSVHRLEALLNDILDLSRLESRPETLEVEVIDFAGVARSACEDLANRAKRADIRLTCSAPHQTMIQGDARAVHRVVDNLVVNALNYTPAGGEVSVEVRAEDGVARMTVTDTGIGIPADSLERIFERFYRVDKARSRSAGGTGLGLAITKHAIGLHRGTIEVRSEVGRGTTFTVRIPLIPQPVGVERTKESI